MSNETEIEISEELGAPVHSSVQQRIPDSLSGATFKKINAEKELSQVAALNGKKFAALRKEMAKNIREAEDKGALRIEEIRNERETAKNELQREAFANEERTPSVGAEEKEKAPEATPTSEPVKAETEDKRSDADSLVLTLDPGAARGDEKCILQLSVPSMPYFIGMPYCPNNACYPNTVPQNSYTPPTFGYSAPSAPIPEPEEKTDDADPDFYGDVSEEYSVPYPEYPDPLPEMYGVSEATPEEELPKSEYDRATVSAEDEYHMMREQNELLDPKSEEVDIFARAQLVKVINSYNKEVYAYERKIQKLEARQNDADTEQNIALVVEKIALQKELCELSIEILGACVYASSKGKTARQQRALRSHIDKYNLFCDEYEKLTGRPLDRLNYGIIDDVLAGRISKPIPNVYYYGAEGDASFSPNDLQADRAHREDDEYAALSREYDRYLEDGGAIELTPQEKSRAEKKSAARISAIRRATERDILLVALRNEYRLDSLEARRDILVNSYGSDRGRVMKELHSIERTMSKVRAASRRSIPLEREDNTRYYLLAALDMENEKIKDGARRDRLASLRQRLEVLLSERESINERLIVLYGGSDKKLKKAKINRKAAAVRRKAARKAFKKQGDLARRIERFNVSADMKERAYALLNQKTAAVARAEEARYKLKRLNPRGRAKGELLSEFKRAKKEIKRTDSEIRYMLRRLKKIQDRHADRRELAILFSLIAVFVLAVGAVWLAFGSDISAYFKDLFAKLRGL